MNHSFSNNNKMKKESGLSTVNICQFLANRVQYKSNKKKKSYSKNNRRLGTYLSYIRNLNFAHLNYI